MDSSNSKVQAVLGQLRVDAAELTNFEWYEIVTAAIEQFEPMLQYLPGFTPIGETMNGWRRGGYHRETDMGIVQFPEGFNTSTKCLYITTVCHTVEGEMPEGIGCRFVEEKILYLTTKGKIILSDHRYEQVRRRVQLYEVAIHWRFSQVGGRVLADILTPNVGCSILDVLVAYGKKSIENRRMHLDNAERTTNAVEGIRRRIHGLGRMIVL